ncbi:hypothetical protein [Streptomyces griseorubiginosus]|uniref:hypothetical protein n=1 Tax=Streptomyces griseorubiginosus TaxID=67304 RepID=UPI0033D01435
MTDQPTVNSNPTPDPARVIRAPWTPDQVDALNAFQRRGGMHPFTCGGEHTPASPALVAYTDGWRCPQPYGESCDYRQDWAHAFMAEAPAPTASSSPPTDPTHGLSVQQADALWDAVAIPGPQEPTFPVQHERVCRAVAAILDELAPAAPSAVDQTTRDRIAEAPCVCGEPETPGTRHRTDGPCYVVDAQLRAAALAIARVEAWKWADGEPLESKPLWQSYLAQAAAVLAVLPPTTDQAAVLREEAALIRAHCPDHLDSNSAEGSWIDCHCAVADDMDKRAAEAAHSCRNCEGVDPGTCLMNPDRPRSDALKRAHVALAEQAGRDQAALERVRRLHDSLIEETDLSGPDDLITKGSAARRIATALDGWNPALLPSCDVEFEGGGRCAKPAGHRPPGSDDPHVPAVGARQPDTETRPVVRIVNPQTGYGMGTGGNQPTSTAPLAAGLPLVQGNCPACHGASLFLGDGGYVTCSRIDCPEPDAATTALETPAAASAVPGRSAATSTDEEA